MSQFFFKSMRSTEDKIIYDSFNIESVLRTTMTDEGQLLVELNDGRIEEKVFWKRDANKQLIYNKEGNPIKMHTAKEWISSDALIADPEDIDRFKKTADVNYYDSLFPETGEVFRAETATALKETE